MTTKAPRSILMNDIVHNISADFLRIYSIPCAITILNDKTVPVNSITFELNIGGHILPITLIPLLKPKSRTAQLRYFQLIVPERVLKINRTVAYGLVKMFAGVFLEHEEHLWKKINSFSSGPQHARSDKKEIVQALMLKNSCDHISSEYRIMVTEQCNQKCIFCCVEKDVEYDWPTIKKQVLELKVKTSRKKNIIIALTGGEPTIAPFFFELLDIVRSAAFPAVTLQTNGVMLADTALVQEIFRAGIHNILFSFHSHRATTYDLLTGTKHLFPQALAGIKHVLHFPFKSIIFNQVINSYNYTSIESYLRFIQKLIARKKRKTTISFMPSIVNMDVDNGHWQALAVPYTKILPYLNKAIEYNDALFSSFTGDCYFPICIGKDYPRIMRYAPRARITQDTVYVSDSAKIPCGARIKHVECRHCIYDRSCGGLCYEYARTFGLRELSPITQAVNGRRSAPFDLDRA